MRSREEANMHETKKAALAGLIVASFACASAAA
jgi:hypothetical protein